MAVALLVARGFLAAVFAVAGVAKLRDLEASRRAVADFGVPAGLARVAGTALPFAELAVAVALVPATTARAGAVGALVLLAAFSIAIGVNLARGRKPACNCFGQLSSEPVGPWTLARNLALAAVAAVLVVAPDTSEVSVGSLSATALWVLGGVALVALVLVVGIGVYLQLVRQHGRLLLRVEALETALVEHGIDLPGTFADDEPGLPLGSAAPPFAVADLDGASVDLASLLVAGRPVLLVFTDPRCGPCRALLPRIGEWRREHGDRLTIGVIGRGDADELRTEAADHGVTILVEPDVEISSRYRADATPSAVLVDASGAIASGVVAGGAAIAHLVDHVVYAGEEAGGDRHG